MRELKTKHYGFIISFALALTVISCSKKVTYLAPIAISESLTDSLSIEKQIGYRFVTASKDDASVFERLLGEDFISRDQKWNGTKQDFIQKRNADLSFDQIKPVRILQDGALIALHSRMLGDTLKFRWDILRIEGQQIQEHWSNVNDSIGVNPDNHTEIDGPTVPQQLEKTAENRALIARFIDQCMIREAGGAAKFFNFTFYTQHNRDVGDGLNGLLWGMYKMKRANQIIKFKYNYHVIAEGNFVLSATEGYAGNEKVAFYDLFRIEKNKIVEHWDIIAPLHKFSYFKEE